MHKIDKVSFGLLSPETIRQIAKVRIVSSDLYDPDGYPVEGGVMDPRLGVIDPGLHCRTCGGGIGDCPGHFGYLELAKPIINVLYTKTLYQILRFSCGKCNRIMLDKDMPDFFDRVLIAPAKCPHCKKKTEKISFVKPYAYYEGKKELTPLDMRERFEKIPDKDLKKINFCGGRPEWLIMTLFPVPPVTMRPSITLEGGERSEDDLTHKLVDVVRINQSLKENLDIGAPDFILNDLWELVQYHISTYFDNELTGAPMARHRSGRALKGIIQRLKAKEGRIRGNLLGKRVNFSARTVISPDPKISINEVGVPFEVAKELTVPMYVTAMNTKKIKEMIKEGKVNYIIRPDKRRVKLTEDNKKDILDNITVDWAVDRQLQDGDIVLFNRQPSLHRVSIMAHRVVVMPYQTFRMNPSVCFPYNADFDGDEMNLHALQTEEARAEAMLLMDVQNNIISPKSGGPVIGLDLDQISGMFLLTHHDVVLSREEAAQLFADASVDIDLPEGKKTFTGKEIFSLLLPENCNVEFEANLAKTMSDLSYEEKKKNDAVVVIRKGVLEKGVIDKASLGSEDGKLIRELYSLFGAEKMKDFINSAGQLGVAYVMKRGLTIGISDLDVPTKYEKRIQQEVEKAEVEAFDLIDQYTKNTIQILPGMTKKGSLETLIMNALASGVSRAADIVAQINQHTDIVNLAKAGAKGSYINMTQMMAIVGQETILGKRIRRGYLKRTLPHFIQKDLSPASRGFVKRGFKDGLTPFELFWNIMNGREGLMDKSLRTRKSGYMQRRLVNALQDLKVKHDLTIRNADGKITQFIAGEDMVDPSKSFWGKVNLQQVFSEFKKRSKKEDAERAMVAG